MPTAVRCDTRQSTSALTHSMLAAQAQSKIKILEKVSYQSNVQFRITYQ
jgi:hypothetical protein